MQLTIQEILATLTSTDRVSFTGRVIEEELPIVRNQRESTIALTGCTFQKDVSLFIKEGSPTSIDFSGSVFNGNLMIDISSVSNSKIIMRGADFQNGFTIKSNAAIEFDCSDSTWQSEIDIEESTFQDFTFEKVTAAYGSILHGDHIQIIGVASFKGSKLGQTYFNNGHFHMNVSFDQTSFEGAYFMNADFRADLYLNNTEFGDTAMFNGSQVKGKVIAPFINSKSVNCIGDFSGCRFEKNVYFDTAIFHKLICTRSNFQESVSFNNSKIWFVDFIGTFFAQGADFSNTKYPTGSIETFRIIKSELLKAENKVESLYYKSQELNRYEDQLTWSDQKLEKGMLLFNRLSTNHGIDWGSGVKFTIGFSLFFYVLYITCLPGRAFEWGWAGFDSFCKATDYVIKNYFKFLIIVRDFTFVEKSTPNALSYTIDFIARIFIGFGVYQTIQAFRKYGKS